MVFFYTQPEELRIEYEQFLKLAGCLSNLFSESMTPYLYYRLAEKVFCRAFKADDLSRSDVSADAKKGDLGIGVKTFIYNDTPSFQKVAEFNYDRNSYKNLSNHDLIRRISELRNARIEFTKNTHALTKIIYHCILRLKGKFLIVEEPMDTIDLLNISDIKERKGGIAFTDGKNEYSFLLSKSTLTKRFMGTPILHEFNVDILKDPLLELQKRLKIRDHQTGTKTVIKQTIYLPLYGKNHIVFEKSGLNFWNASGRIRHPNEVYIPIPIAINQQFPLFFSGSRNVI